MSDMMYARTEHSAIERADIAVYDRDGQLQLIAEVKGRLAAEPDWAAQIRGNLMDHLGLPNAPFFLLALPDRFYLWHNLPDPRAVVPADYVIDPAPLLAPYLDDNYRLSERLSDTTLILAVSGWLSFLTWATASEEQAAGAARWLFDSGLYRAIRGGTVRS